MIAAAQEEGELVIALSGSDSRTGRFAFETFADTFGINVVTSSGSGADNANRILCRALERRVHRGHIHRERGLDGAPAGKPAPSRR